MIALVCLASGIVIMAAEVLTRRPLPVPVFGLGLVLVAAGGVLV